MVYDFETKAVSVHIELENCTVWLSINQIADMFGLYISAVTINLQSLYKEDEALLRANSQYYYVTPANRESVSRTLFNLDIVILLVYKMMGGNCHLFRQWMREQAKRPIIESRQNPILIQIRKNSFFN